MSNVRQHKWHCRRGTSEFKARRPTVLLSCGGRRLAARMNSDDESSHFIESTARSALRPTVGLPLFAALFVCALAAKNALGADEAGLVLVLLLFVFPYYLMQLLMRWRLRQHAKRHGPNVRYVPSASRVWASVYLGCWFLTAWAVTLMDRLTRG